MKDRKIKAGTTAVLVLAMVFAGTFSAYALTGKKTNYSGWRDADAPIINLLIQLDLTDEQKAQIAEALKDYREPLKESVNKMVEARKTLFGAIHSDQYNEDAVRTASGTVAAAEEELAVLRAGLSAEIRAVLTSEQLALVQDFILEMAEKLNEKIEKVHALIDYWIDKNS